MLADRYGLPLTTGSAAAAAAFAEGQDRLLTFWPDAAEAFDRATAEDPGFAMAHAGRAHAAMRLGDAAAARRSLAAATRPGLAPWEASHIAYLGLLLAGETAAALEAVPRHVREAPCDALLLVTACTPNGLIGSSGRAGRHAYLAGLMDSLAPHYGADWWFSVMHGMALSEAGDAAAARPKVARGFAARPDNAWGAHAEAHVLYEAGEMEAARSVLRAWLPGYPRAGGLHGHLAWHMALGDLAVGDTDRAWAVFAAECAPEVHAGPARVKLSDAASFLWRWELAGNPRDPARWQVVRDFARAMFPRPGFAFADLHVALAEAVAGDGAALEAWVAQVAALDRAGRYPSGAVLPAVAAGLAAFARQDWAGAVETLAPVAAERDRIGGSRAQMDLVHATLVRACVLAGRVEMVPGVLAGRRGV